MVNCKELQPVIQLSKLPINSADNVEWLPTYYQVEPISDDVNTKTDDDQISIISISSTSSEVFDITFHHIYFWSQTFHKFQKQ